MSAKKKVVISAVERVALKNSRFEIQYPEVENIPTLVVDNFPALGKLAAMRFLEWVQRNPEGVISLPTGKTPEHFIKWVTRLLETWEQKQTAKILEQAGIDPAVKPQMAGLQFVQIDEFYPINPKQTNSFYSYVNHYYIEGFGLDPERALLINCDEIGLKKGQRLLDVWPEQTVDLGLRYRHGRNSAERQQKSTLEAIDQWCQEYEAELRKRGGIGFFLGGIGPDGHIGFNVQGSDHYSTTRLTPTNYETQAAAAGDLGGIEVSRKRHVITIGLGTITFNPKCVAIIIAAGEAKARIVADAIQSGRNVRHPASSLQVLPNARFYITRGATKHLSARQLQLIRDADTITDDVAERVLVDLAIASGTSVTSLDDGDASADAGTREILLHAKRSLSDFAQGVHDSLESKLRRGLQSLENKRFLHTEPHHDDLMLGYLPYIVRHTRLASNRHYFACLTSGFTAVTNAFMREKLSYLRELLHTDEFARLFDQDYFEPDNMNGRNRDVWQYLDGVAAKSRTMKRNGVARRLLRDLVTVFDERDLAQIGNRVNELDSYFEKQYPGKKDLEYIQRLKGMSREYEAESLWGYFGWSCQNVFHLRLGFYKGDIFTEEPTFERDVQPTLELLEKTNPDIVTVALDPEASGPDTHYKVLQAITEALKRYEAKTGRSDIKVWGYRNVWYRFHPSEANIFIPVSLNMFAIMHSAFMNSFLSQKAASFPSYEHDGPFSELAQKIQVQQFQHIKTCLGRSWFYESDSPLIRATRGLVYLKEMSLEEFYERSRELKQAAENR